MRTRYFEKLYDADPDGGGGGGGGDDKGGDDQSAVIKQMQFDRDSARAQVTKLSKKVEELSGQILSEEDRELFQTLREQHAAAEEDKKRKAGEFDQWREQIAKKHEAALEAERLKVADEVKRREAAETRLNDTLVGLEFAGATEWFGPSGKTVLPAEVAQAYFRKQIDVEVDDETGTRSVVVRDRSGAVMIDAKTGKPMPFAKAIGELIDTHPQKAEILRGSGKVGSGSSGGGGGGADDIDLASLTSEQARDPKVIDKLKKRRPAGRIAMGTAYDS